MKKPKPITQKAKKEPKQRLFLDELASEPAVIAATAKLSNAIIDTISETLQTMGYTVPGPPDKPAAKSMWVIPFRGHHYVEAASQQQAEAASAKSVKAYAHRMLTHGKPACKTLDDVKNDFGLTACSTGGGCTALYNDLSTLQFGIYVTDSHDNTPTQESEAFFVWVEDPDGTRRYEHETSNTNHLYELVSAAFMLWGN